MDCNQRRRQYDEVMRPFGGSFGSVEYIGIVLKLLIHFISDMKQPSQSEYSQLNQHINQFIKPNDFQAWLAIAVSVAYEVLAVGLIHLNLGLLGWAVHTLNIVRVFIQFHDMAHFSFFQSIQLNKLVGHIIGVYTHFPFDMWRDGHNFHHKHFGNLDKVDLSQTILFNKETYEKWATPKKIIVRIFREPVVFFFFTVQVLWFFGILFNCLKRYGPLSPAVFEKILSVVVYFWMFDLLGLPVWKMYLSLHVAQAIGTILFHLQHSVNLPYREHKDSWNFTSAALEGSTYLQIPMLLRPFTNGIEYHHIHHLNTNVASYVIQRCHQNFEKMDKSGHKWDLFNINRVGAWLAIKSLWNVMLDEQNRTLIPFSYTSL